MTYRHCTEQTCSPRIHDCGLDSPRSKTLALTPSSKSPRLVTIRLATRWIGTWLSGLDKSNGQ